MTAGKESFQSRLCGLFLTPVDARIYACVRIAFAFVSLLNLMQIWPDRAIFFTDAGMVDQEVVRKFTVGAYVSVFDVCRDVSSVSTYLMFSGAAMLLLLFGVWSRLAAVIVYVWYVSYAMRAPLILVGWDEVLRCTAFLVMISPLPDCWCWKSRKARRQAAPEKEAPCYGLTLMRVQLAVIYLQAVLARLDNEYWMGGDFMSFFLLSHNARWPGLWVLNFGFLLKVVTYLVLLVELAIPFLLMVRRWRWYGFATGILLHAGISLMSYNLMLFFLAMLTLYLSFLQKEDMDWLERKLGRRR
ncbi:HTTM domain-containing protein [Prosthecobacter fluviatilis]|uniref:HTTM domain-containing protein n=1 Tax=Prosthecobacter fluviatilis TaxID=445931 RepID=A0ABW0KR20_9BACT